MDRTIYVKAELTGLQALLNRGLITINEYRSNAARLLRELELMGA